MSRNSPPFTESEVNFRVHNSQQLHPLLQHKSPLHIVSVTTLTRLRVRQQNKDGVTFLAGAEIFLP
jgi:hypothetical protein